MATQLLTLDSSIGQPATAGGSLLGSAWISRPGIPDAQLSGGGRTSSSSSIFRRKIARTPSCRCNQHLCRPLAVERFHTALRLIRAATASSRPAALAGDMPEDLPIRLKLLPVPALSRTLLIWV